MDTEAKTVFGNCIVEGVRGTKFPIVKQYTLSSAYCTGPSMCTRAALRIAIRGSGWDSKYGIMVPVSLIIVPSTESCASGNPALPRKYKYPVMHVNTSTNED